MAALRNAAVVCLDVDSTVCRDEGIDKLAEACGVGPEVAAWYVDDKELQRGTGSPASERDDKTA